MISIRRQDSHGQSVHVFVVAGRANLAHSVKKLMAEDTDALVEKDLGDLAKVIHYIVTHVDERPPPSVCPSAGLSAILSDILARGRQA